jgi:outer membrane protein assembly factor BamB
LTRPAALWALCAALASGCFHDLDPRVVLGQQGYVPPSYLVFPHWSRRLTFNDPWDYKPLEYAVPAVSDNGERVYAGSRQGDLSCFDVRTGRLVWRIRIGREVRSHILYQEGTLFFGAGDGRLYAVDAEEGKVRWKYAAKAEVSARPVITTTRAFFTSNDHMVYAVDADTGEWRWHYARPVPEGFTMQGQAGPLLHKGSLFVGFADGYLVSLKAQDGALQWEKRLSEATRFGDVDTTPALAGGTLLAAAFNEGLFALDPADGIIRWKIPAAGASTPSVAGDVGYFTTPAGEIASFSVADGKVRWRVRIDPGYLSPPVVYRRWLLVSQSEITTVKTRGGVYVLDRDTGKVETVIDIGQGVRGAPVAARGHLFFLTDSGWLHAYRFGRGWSR